MASDKPARMGGIQMHGQNFGGAVPGDGAARHVPVEHRGARALGRQAQTQFFFQPAQLGGLVYAPGLPRSAQNHQSAADFFRLLWRRVWDGRLKKAEIPTHFSKVSETWRAACVAPAMRVTPNLEQSSSGSLKGAVTLTRAIEKSSPSSALHQQPPQTHQAEEKTPPRIQVELVCQAGTEAFDPNLGRPAPAADFCCAGDGPGHAGTAHQQRRWKPPMAPRAWAAWRCCWTARAEAAPSRSGRRPQTEAGRPARLLQKNQTSRQQAAPASTGIKRHAVDGRRDHGQPGQHHRRQSQRPESRDSAARPQASATTSASAAKPTGSGRAKRARVETISAPAASGSRNKHRHIGQPQRRWTPPAPPAARRQSADKAVRANARMPTETTRQPWRQTAP